MTFNRRAKTTVISGIGPGPHGVSRLVEHIMKSDNYKVICPGTTPSLRKELQHGYWRFMESGVRFIFTSFLFKLKLIWLVLAKIDNLVVIHHHSIGVVSTILLMMRARNVKYFCVDSSFFCIMSYNFRDSSECIRCVYGEPAPVDCRVFPSRSPKFMHKWFFRHMSRTSHRVLFLCQTDAQARLVQMRYPKADRRVVGLMTSDVEEEIHESLKENASRQSFAETPLIDGRYLIFHGSSHPAKGFFALFDSPAFTSRRIVFPFEREEVEARAQAEGHTLPSNWEFLTLSWGSGLRSACIGAEAVLCPSRWSAPIEGALIKSLCANSNVIVWGSDFSYASEIPDDVVWNAGKVSPAEILVRIDAQDGYDLERRTARVHEFLRRFQTKNRDMLL